MFFLITYSDVILTTDIIVGFPGETEEEFNNTYEFLKEIKFYKMHIFKYSRRKGTKADLMDNQVSPQIQEQRSKMLLELSDRKQEEYNRKYIGQILEVLIEEQQGEYIKGHTENYLIVKIKSNQLDKYHNKILNLKITDVNEEDLNSRIKLSLFISCNENITEYVEVKENTENETIQ